MSVHDTSQTDIDDDVAIIGSQAPDLKFKVLGIVGVGYPAELIARRTKALVKSVDGNVPVAAGKNFLAEGLNATEMRLRYPENDSLLADRNEIEHDAQAMMERIYASAPDRSISTIICANMTDFAYFLEKHAKLVQQKSKRIHIMGGLQQNSELSDAKASDLYRMNGLLLASKFATNNYHNQAAADFTYERIQSLGINATITTRSAAIAVGAYLGPDFLRQLAETTGHFAAKHINDRHDEHRNWFWQAAYDKKLHPDKDASWFIDTHCKEGTPRDLKKTDDIVPHIKGTMLYDFLPYVAAIDQFRAYYFKPLPVGNNMEIIGLSRQETGVARPKELARDLFGWMHQALSRTNQAEARAERGALHGPQEKREMPKRPEPRGR